MLFIIGHVCLVFFVSSLSLHNAILPTVSEHNNKSMNTSATIDVEAQNGSYYKLVVEEHGDLIKECCRKIEN